jgi:hypothetical protein
VAENQVCVAGTAVVSWAVSGCILCSLLLLLLFRLFRVLVLFFLDGSAPPSLPKYLLALPHFHRTRSSCACLLTLLLCVFCVLVSLSLSLSLSLASVSISFPLGSVFENYAIVLKEIAKLGGRQYDMACVTSCEEKLVVLAQAKIEWENQPPPKPGMHFLIDDFETPPQHERALLTEPLLTEKTGCK